MQLDNQVQFDKYRASIEEFHYRLNAGDEFTSGILGAMANSADEFESMFVTPTLRKSEILRIAAITDYYQELRDHYRESVQGLKVAFGIADDPSELDFK